MILYSRHQVGRDSIVGISFHYQTIDMNSDKKVAVFVITLVLATLWIIVNSFIHAAHADQTVITNFNTTKTKYFWPILYKDGGETLYCNQTFNNKRMLHVEHVYPASWIATQMRCKSRSQCRTNEETKIRFNHAEADMHNLWPAMAGANQARSNYNFGIIEGETPLMNFCDLEIDAINKIAEPARSARGKIARSILYMTAEYDLLISKNGRQLMVKWDNKHPPTESEYIRHETISRIQNTRNAFIDAHSQSAVNFKPGVLYK